MGKPFEIVVYDALLKSFREILAETEKEAAERIKQGKIDALVPVDRKQGFFPEKVHKPLPPHNATNPFEAS
jgi:hypothetical protein